MAENTNKDQGAPGSNKGGYGTGNDQGRTGTDSPTGTTPGTRAEDEQTNTGRGAQGAGNAGMDTDRKPEAGRKGDDVNNEDRTTPAGNRGDQNTERGDRNGNR